MTEIDPHNTLSALEVIDTGIKIGLGGVSNSRRRLVDPQIPSTTSEEDKD
jgi:hypothetical protein